MDPCAVSFFTLGCKLNQLETEAIAEAFREQGFSVRSWQEAGRGDLSIVNTCTVTSRAEQKARRIIRLLLGRGSTVLVSGCYARLGGPELSALGSGNLFLVPPKDALLDLPRFLADAGGSPEKFLSRWLEEQVLLRKAGKGSAGALPEGFRFNPRVFSFHSRAFLKIQDGCDRSCAYCRVPLARGKSISLETPELLTRLRALEARGLPEAVLTGVSICQYRSRFRGDKPVNLPALLRILLEHTGKIALRLSSIEPEPAVLTDEFFQILSHPRIRPHFHLSVQSGSSRILSAMGRPYGVNDIVRAAERLRQIKEDPFLACDMITGFPGETEEDFEASAALCRDLGFAAIHGFPYSKRGGTRAAVMRGQVSQGTAGKRLAVLLELSRQGRRDYVGRWLGKTVGAVAESKRTQGAEKDGAAPFPAKKTGFFHSVFPALTDNYIRLLVSSADPNTGTEDFSVRPGPGSTLNCRIQTHLPGKDFDAWGKVVRMV
ncbi:MAG: MiaB/RimO family radical SAM methylthiotransferase [Spirochaetaceae bacterium]|jgi:threonylcarbamoyladenosine tRNA methylthiotransferase MtaB|nr:MiaB/RimO family radical SAM methylthiotransferase [Spirochaetaceae bacterium]